MVRFVNSLEGTRAYVKELILIHHLFYVYPETSPPKSKCRTTFEVNLVP